MDVDRAVKDVFAENEWMVKTGIGGILTAGSTIALLYHFACLPVAVACWAVMIGYILRVIRQKVADPKAKLPLWNDWGDLFISGITWIAFQFILWILTLSICIFAVVFCSMRAAAAGSSWETVMWSALGPLLLAVTCGNLAYVSSYLMVNFAVEENSIAAISYLKIMKRIARHPLHYYTGFMLATGVQWAAVLVPAATMIGLFVIPSTYFIGQIAGAAILARYWSADRDPSVK